MANYCRIDSIGEHVKSFALCLEDDRFYIEKWYDLKMMRYFFFYNIRHRETKRGASTITQQLAKNMYFAFEKTYFRKASEWFVARELYRVLSKDEILELYLNIVYFGNGQYGIGDAASFYFDKAPKDLTINQSVMLIAILCMPTRANPLKHPDIFLRRRRKALLRLATRGLITLDEANQIIRDYSDAMLDPELRVDRPVDAEDRVPPLNEAFYFEYFAIN